MAKRISLEETLDEFTKMAQAKSGAAVTRDNPDGSDHPAAKPPENNSTDIPEGEHARESDAEVSANVPGSVNDAAGPDASEEGSDAVEFVGAPASEGDEDKQTFKTTAQDPGTESLADVSVEKTAADIDRAVRAKGRAKVAGDLAREALGFFDAAIGRNKRAGTAKAAAAGAEASAAAVDPVFVGFMKSAAVEAVNEAIHNAVALGEYWQAKQAEGGLEDEVEPEPEAEAGLEEVGDVSEELPPEALAELMQVAGGGEGGMGGGLEEGGIDPSVVAIISEILDQAGITPEDAMGIEANATALDPEGVPEEKMAYLKQASLALRGVSLFRARDPMKDFQKRASTINRDYVARGVREYVAKAAYVVRRRQEEAALAAR